MKIGIFTYNFPHYKSQQGLLNLFVNGYKPEVIFAQNLKELKFYKSNIRTNPIYTVLNNPCEIAKSFNIDVVIADHNSSKVYNYIKDKNLDLGIIFGSRILKSNIIDCFNIGILNIHPGIIPINRGLDNLKWAIIHSIKQGITSHLIDEKIDMGSIINIEIIDVNFQDSLIDIDIKLHEKGQEMMLKAINFLIKGKSPVPIILEGNYNISMDIKTESLLMYKFEYYKQYYNLMRIE